jgi:transcriptional regulator with XRE-family HTH domain
MNNLKTNFGKKLRQLRRGKDFTQEKLAEKVGISVEFLSGLERGIYGPSFDTLEKLAAVLNVDFKTLFEFEE